MSRVCTYPCTYSSASTLWSFVPGQLTQLLAQL